jgi:hypothetical protein
MSEIEGAGQATDRAVLEQQIMDPNVPKNEREWWAAREIERLRAALAPPEQPDGELDYALRSALRFAASRAAITARQEKAILAVFTAQPREAADVVEAVALAIERADRQSGIPEGSVEHPEVSSWGEHLARAAIATLSPSSRTDTENAPSREDILREVINSPETADFMAGVPIEAAHQRERWGSEHDAGKSPFDWFWLIGFLAQKAAASAVAGDTEKALHHTISTAAALANWHAALTGADNAMRPGIVPPLPTKDTTTDG